MEAGGEGRALREGERVAVEGAHAGWLLVDAPLEAVGPKGPGRHAAAAARVVSHGVDAQSAAFQTLGRIVLNGLRMAAPELGETAAVVGCGLLGQLAIRFLRLAGVMPAAAADLAPDRLEGAARSGADIVIDA